MGTETPLMEQYRRIKAEHQGEILLFRMGDFYEMFCEDARVGARVLGLTLTTRNNGAAGRVPLAGVPVKAVEGYIAKLVAAGLKVAVCDQVEDPRKAKGIVKRAVTEVITPGMVMNESLLAAVKNNFIAAAHPARGGLVALAWCDVSTGEFYLEAVEAAKLADEVLRICPAELLLEGADGLPEPPGPGRTQPLLDLIGQDRPENLHLTYLEDWRFDRQSCLDLLHRHFGVASLEGFGIGDDHPAAVAAGVLLDYVARLQPASLDHVRTIQPYFPGRLMVLDADTVSNLELVESFRGGREGTLLDTLDHTLTAMGARALRRWLLEPLVDFEAIRGRHDRVEALVNNSALRCELRALLEAVSDIERLVARISSGRAGPREVVALGRSLSRLPGIRKLLEDSESEALEQSAAELEEFPALVKLIEDSVVEDPPVSLADGGVIRPGYNRKLDELRSLVAEGKSWIARMEEQERRRTGISNLKIRYNRVFGYFIEVTKSNLKQVPEDFIRKQTISTGERFITPELKEYEDKVLGAEEKIAVMESELFSGLREHLASFSAGLQKAAQKTAEIDVLAALAEVAVENKYVRPEMVEGDRVEIEQGRHPVVECMMDREQFVPNDLVMDNRASQIIILTGPNMAGKSTILRQMGLIVLLAHMGSFVPARRAGICLVDRIFTRVGASDNLARGQSTFMVEMNETANILNNATPQSLILLDEIGRGTSTFDGLSIAWAVTEFLHENPARAAKTVFATHYHELTELEAMLARVRNYNVLVKDYGERVIFLHKIAPGGSDRSYGIQVARLAGIPQEVIDRAREVLNNLESGEFTADHLPALARGKMAPEPKLKHDQLPLFSVAPPNPALERLKEVEPDKLSPIEALELIYELKKKASGGAEKEKR
ncbi:MAG: DNA mismatch repair protein MutS [Candidatus Glassbacteria bacterium]|nr:DNA mismatch repair protein MutS [Candidatus Glassbacteria bacterium]